MAYNMLIRIVNELIKIAFYEFHDVLLLEYLIIKSLENFAPRKRVGPKESCS